MAIAIPSTGSGQCSKLAELVQSQVEIAFPAAAMIWRMGRKRAFHLMCFMPSWMERIPIWTFREFRGMTQDAMAKSAGITVPYLSQLESGTRKGAIEVMVRVQKLCMGI